MFCVWYSMSFTRRFAGRSFKCSRSASMTVCRPFAGLSSRRSPTPSLSIILALLRAELIEPPHPGEGEYLTRQINERTEKLAIMGDNVGDLQEQSSGWADDVNKFVGKQKRNIVLGGLKSKFF